LVIAWLVVAIALVLLELHHWAFYSLFVAVGCVAAALVALAAPGAIAAQAVVGVVVATVGVVGVRPLISQAVHRHRGGEVGRGVHGGIIGQEVITLDEVGDQHVPGHVRLAGERWLAVSGSGGRIAAHTPVLVTAIQGTTLVVLPLSELQEGSET
jgi:membrane protein implicated in regulation of membrane protease activity